MRELQRVVTEFERAEAAGAALVLATVVHVEGSTYRRPGARLLVAEDRWLAGGVSGGCLEGDVLKRAFHRTAGGRPVLVEYDSRLEADSAWTHALGCNGLVEVLLEPLRADAAVHPLRTVAGWLRGAAPGVLVTPFRGSPAGLVRPGDRLALGPDGSVSHALPEAIAAPLLAEARAALADRRTRVARVPVPGGAVEALVEVIAPPPRIVVVGEGPDVPPVVEQAWALGWRTTLVLARHTAAAAPAAARADAVVVCDDAGLARRMPLDGVAAAVVMSHTYARDRAALAALLASAVPYVGMLGPRRRTDKLLGDLAREGLRPGPRTLSRIYSPVGLDLGAEEPEEIALGIVAEIQAVLRGRRPASLREVDGPIHERPDG